VLERIFQRFGGYVHGLHRIVTCRVSRGARVFARTPRALAGLPLSLACLSCVLGKLPETFRFMSGGFDGAIVGLS
jgi:hypothetical protein